MADILVPPGNEPTQKRELVPFLRRDVGTSALRSLPQERIADLIDLAGSLAQLFPITANRRITRAQFDAKLKRHGQHHEIEAKLLNIVGWNQHGVVPAFDIWWAWAWVFNFTRAVNDEDDRPEDEKSARELAAAKMGLTPKVIHERLARRDISFLVNIFLARTCREMEGEIMWKTTIAASTGSAKAMEMYFRYVSEKSEKQDVFESIDPSRKSEAELKADIEKMKKSLGITGETIDVEDTVTAEFEIKELPHE